MFLEIPELEEILNAPLVLLCLLQSPEIRLTEPEHMYEKCESIIPSNLVY